MELTPLYIDNAFRFLRLPSNASPVEIHQQARRLRDEAARNGAEPEVERFALAASRLDDPVTRLTQGLYWFWLTPDHVPPRTLSMAPHAIRALAQRLEAMATTDPDDVALHDLAVLRHAAVIEVPAAGDLWGAALENWERVWRSERFWMSVRRRATGMDDLRVTGATVDRMREHLPARILQATADQVANLLAGGGDPGSAIAAMSRSGLPNAGFYPPRCDAAQRAFAAANELLAELKGATCSAGRELDRIGTSDWTDYRDRRIETARRLWALDAHSPADSPATEVSVVEPVDVHEAQETARWSPLIKSWTDAGPQPVVQRWTIAGAGVLIARIAMVLVLTVAAVLLAEHLSWR